jgi:hypothetical protein
MPKLIEQDSRFRFYWGEGGHQLDKHPPKEKYDIKDILKELVLQYLDHHTNMFGTDEHEMLICRHNLDILQFAIGEMKDGTKKDSKGDPL